MTTFEYRSNCYFIAVFPKNWKKKSRKLILMYMQFYVPEHSFMYVTVSC